MFGNKGSNEAIDGYNKQKEHKQEIQKTGCKYIREKTSEMYEKDI